MPTIRLHTHIHIMSDAKAICLFFNSWFLRCCCCWFVDGSASSKTVCSTQKHTWMCMVLGKWERIQKKFTLCENRSAWLCWYGRLNICQLLFGAGYVPMEATRVDRQPQSGYSLSDTLFRNKTMCDDSNAMETDQFLCYEISGSNVNAYLHYV